MTSAQSLKSSQTAQQAMPRPTVAIEPWLSEGCLWHVAAPLCQGHLSRCVDFNLRPKANVRKRCSEALV